MKKILLVLVILTAGCITAYTVLLWEPKTLGSEKVQEDKSSIAMNQEENSKEVESKVTDNKEETKSVSNYSQSIFKVEVSTIVSQLSKESYSELFEIVTSLSSTDIGRIEEALRDRDREAGARKVIGILKKRLSNESYNKVEEVLSPYINFEVLNKEI